LVTRILDLEKGLETVKPFQLHLSVFDAELPVNTPLFGVGLV
jgi:hypothetical protein